MNTNYPVYLLLRMVLILILMSGCSATSGIKHDLDRNLKESQAFKKGFVGLIVFDPLNNEVLFQHNAHKYFTPASNLKLLTLYSGIKLLGDRIPHLKYMVEGDSLFFTGTGDPSLLHPSLPPSPVLDFLESTTHELYLVPGTPVPPLGSGWAWDDYNWEYSAERSALPVYGNVATVTIGKNAEVFPDLFQDSLVKYTNQQDRGIFRKIRSNVFLYPAEVAPADQRIPFLTSDRLTALILQDTLDRPVHLYQGSRTFDFDVLASEKNRDTIFRKMLLESDNFLAEQILLMAGSKLEDTLRTSTAIAYMQEHFLRDLPDPVIWVDGSGLSRYNLITPRSLVRILQKLAEEVGYQEIFDLLPTGGRTGTLRNRFISEEPFIFAKTGSLSGVHNLSGFLISRKGRILCFSFMSNNLTATAQEIRKEMDRLLLQIRNNL